MWAISSDLRRNGRGAGHVAFGVDLGDVGFGVAEEDLGLFQAELLSDSRGVRVSKLVWMPVLRRFTLTCQTILSSWMLLTTRTARNAKELTRLALKRCHGAGESGPLVGGLNCTTLGV